MPLFQPVRGMAARWAVAGVAVITLCRGVRAEDTPRTAWLTGRALEARLETVVPKEFWLGVRQAPLRKAIRTISTTQRVAILIDRRVDPDRTLDLTLADMTVGDLLQRIAKDRGLGVTRLGALTYLGPPDVTAQLRTIAQMRRDDLAKLPDGAAESLRASRPMAWDDFATPRELLRRLAESAGIGVKGLERVPHDLWAAADLPSLPLVDRLTLIAVQFDLTFRIADDRRSIELVPLPERIAIVRRYSGGSNPGRLAQRWSRLIPQSQIKVAGHEIFVRGPVEDHERLRASRHTVLRSAPNRPPPSARPEVRFTVLNAKGPLDRLVAELAKKLQLEVRLDRHALERAGISPSQVVSFSAKDATADQLFQAVLSPAGCTFRREGKTIVIVPAQ